MPSEYSLKDLFNRRHRFVYASFKEKI